MSEGGQECWVCGNPATGDEWGGLCDGCAPACEVCGVVRPVVLESELSTGRTVYSVYVMTPARTPGGFRRMLPTAPPWNEWNDSLEQVEARATKVNNLLAKGKWPLRTKKPKWFGDDLCPEPIETEKK